MNSTMGSTPETPRLQKVRVMRQKMPMGATRRMTPIIFIMIALNCVKKRFTVATFLPRRPKMKPSMSAKKMMGNMSPLFIEATMFLGMMLMSISAKVCSVVVAVGSTATTAAMSRPMPGLHTSASMMAMMTAKAVVSK